MCVRPCGYLLKSCIKRWKVAPWRASTAPRPCGSNRERLWTLTESRASSEDFRCGHDERRQPGKFDHQNSARLVARLPRPIPAFLVKTGWWYSLMFWQPRQGRQKLAHGVSRGKRTKNGSAPAGARLTDDRSPTAHAAGFILPPLPGLGSRMIVLPRLTPWANFLRPAGAGNLPNCTTTENWTNYPP